MHPDTVMHPTLLYIILLCLLKPDGFTPHMRSAAIMSFNGLISWTLIIWRRGV